VLVCPAKGFGPTRQWFFEQHDVDRLGRFLFMLDDDLRFFSRRYDDPTKFTPLTKPSEMDVLLGRLRAMLDQVPMAGLDSRSGANRRTPPVHMNGRVFDMHCWDVEVARAAGVRFDAIRFMEDFHANLHLLTRGYPTALLTTHCKDDVRSNAPGGCSTYRDSAGQEAAAKALAAKFPAFVKTTTRPGWGGDMAGTRTDVQVQWAKAFKAGLEGRDLLGIPQHPTPDWEGLAPEWDLL
jgi:hypothetical protein